MIRLSRRFVTAAASAASSNAVKTVPESKSFTLNTYRGKICAEQIAPFPQVLDDSQKEMLEMFVPMVDKLGAENDADKNDLESKFDEKYIEKLKEIGGFGLQVPEKYGGVALTNTQYARSAELMGGHDLALGIFTGAHQSIGYKGITLFGTDAQKDKYLPDLAAGSKIAAFCLTEPTSGSDANSIRSRAELSSDGKHYVLNGNKIWISNGGFADVFTVFAKTPVKTEKGVKDKVTAFIVERDFGGVTSGPPEKKMGIKASNTTEMFFDNVKIPVDNVIGEAGEGFKVAMNILNNGRFGMAAAMSGCMQAVISKATEFAASRTQFGRKLCEFRGIQERLATLAAKQYATQSMAYLIAGNMDQGATDYQMEAAISKIFGSECAWHCCDEAIQILGGSGFMRASGLERVLRDLRIFRIFEGTNDILRLFVALSGIQYAGSELKQLQTAMKNPLANVGTLVGAGAKRAKRAVGLKDVEDLTPFFDPSFSIQSKQVSDSVHDLGHAVEDVLLKYKKGIIDQQNIVSRLGDVSIDLYAMISVLSRASLSLKMGLPSVEHEKLLAITFCDMAMGRVQNNLLNVRSKRMQDTFDRMAEISKGVVENGGVVVPTPIGI